MLGNRIGRSAMMALAMMGAVGASAGRTMELHPTYSPPRRATYTGFHMLYATTRAPGITMAQQKRASRKARNVQRHRAASRG